MKAYGYLHHPHPIGLVVALSVMLVLLSPSIAQAEESWTVEIGTDGTLHVAGSSGLEDLGSWAPGATTTTTLTVHNQMDETAHVTITPRITGDEALLQHLTIASAEAGSHHKAAPGAYAGQVNAGQRKDITFELALDTGTRNAAQHTNADVSFILEATATEGTDTPPPSPASPGTQAPPTTDDPEHGTAPIEEASSGIAGYEPPPPGSGTGEEPGETGQAQRPAPTGTTSTQPSETSQFPAGVLASTGASVGILLILAIVSMVVGIAARRSGRSATTSSQKGASS